MATIHRSDLPERRVQGTPAAFCICVVTRDCRAIANPRYPGKSELPARRKASPEKALAPGSEVPIRVAPLKPSKD
jgi:hypothetical protein